MRHDDTGHAPSTGIDDPPGETSVEPDIDVSLHAGVRTRHVYDVARLNRIERVGQCDVEFIPTRCRHVDGVSTLPIRADLGRTATVPDVDPNLWKAGVSPTPRFKPDFPDDPPEGDLSGRCLAGVGRIFPPVLDCDGA
jgi:hypothetical protein